MNATTRTQGVRTTSKKARNRNAARSSACIKSGGGTKRTAKADTNRGVRCPLLGLINIVMILGSTTLDIKANAAEIKANAAGDGHYYPVWGGEGSDGFCDNDPSRRPPGDDELHERCEDLGRRRFETVGECCNHM